MKGVVVEEVALVMSEDDNVATALADLSAGRELPTDAVEQIEREESLTLTEDVPFGHKFALTTIESGESVRKYGEQIGVASTDIDPGEWVHTHNCDSTRGRGDIDADDGELTEGEA